MPEPRQDGRRDPAPPLSLTTLLDNLPGMAYRRRPDPWRTMEFVSDGCVDLTGYQPADLIGNRLRAYDDLILPADRERVRREIGAALERGERFEVTYRIAAATGEVKWVRERGAGVIDAHGRGAAVEGVVTEATAQERLPRDVDASDSRHTRELTTLLEIARNIAATLDLEALLGLILDEVRAAVEYHGAGMLILEGDELVQLANRGPNPRRSAEGMGMRMRLGGEGIGGLLHRRSEPLVIPDVWADTPEARAYRHVPGDAWLRARPYIRSWVGVPLQFRDRPLGLMVVTYGEPNHFTDHQVRLLAAVGAQASVAIENARLLAAARETAALEERQRLARDLHDAVTQTLFSASLVGDVLPALWERNPQRGAEALQDLRLLTRGALAEMRTLLFELRPAALIETPLGDLLRHLADAVTGRTRLPVTVSAHDVQTLPPDAQIAFYRIAQEALNNVVKHAGATQAEIDLTATPGGAIRLHIRDDGRGFDPKNAPAGHFGMETMRERAAAIGATLAITSGPGRGTDVVITWPAGRNEDEEG